MSKLCLYSQGIKHTSNLNPLNDLPLSDSLPTLPKTNKLQRNKVKDISVDRKCKLEHDLIKSFLDSFYELNEQKHASITS